MRWWTPTLIVLPLLVASGQQPSGGTSQAAAGPTGGQPGRSATAATPPAASAATYALTPRRRALLATIRYAEGTWADGRAEGYRTLYGGGRFASLERHPDTVVVRRYASAAAGAYQFLPATWEAASRRLHLRGFGPANQDQAALYLVDQRGALEAVDRQGLDAETMARLAPEWASFPMLCGNSAYGQPAKSAVDLQRFYQRILREKEASPLGGIDGALN